MRSSSAFATSSVPGAAPSKISALASAMASTEAKEAEVRFADVRPHTDIRFGDPDERADFSRVIHAQLDDRDLRPVSQFHQRQR